MRISDAAKATGLSVSAIRFYERRAVTRRPSRTGRNRDYSEADIRALRFVRNARSLGMSLQSIADVLRRHWQEGTIADVICDHRAAVRSQIDALKQVDSVLAQLETCMCSSLCTCKLADADD